MTMEKIIEVLQRYAQLFYHLGCHRTRQADATTARGNLEHGAWMTQEAIKFAKEGRTDKVNRWLGFIQGVLWSHGIRTIDQMRHDNMPDDAQFEERAELGADIQVTTRPDGPVGARFIGEAGHHDIKMRVYVRSAAGKELPDQRQVENKISDLLLAMPRLDEGAEWDVSSTSLPEGA